MLIFEAGSPGRKATAQMPVAESTRAFMDDLPNHLLRRQRAVMLEEYGQGMLECLWKLQEMLADVTGMAAVSLAPMAGARGEFAGVAMIRAYHDARGDTEESLDDFIEAMSAIRQEAETDPDLLKGAPYTLPVRRLDDVKAAKDLDIRWGG